MDITNFIDKMKKEAKIKKEIVNDDKYFSWLAGFVGKNGDKVCDDGWQYYPEEITNEDKENLWKLHILYEVLSDYACKHEIEINSSSNFYGNSVFVKYNDNNYEIGYLVGQGSFFYCKKTKNDDQLKNIVNFNDILNENNQEEMCK